MKKIVLSIFGLFIMISVVGCNGNDNSESNKSDQNHTYPALTDSEKTITLPIVKESDFDGHQN